MVLHDGLDGIGRKTVTNAVDGDAAVAYAVQAPAGTNHYAAVSCREDRTCSVPGKAFALGETHHGKGPKPIYSSIRANPHIAFPILEKSENRIAGQAIGV